MISFVVCSISDEKLAAFRANVDRTIGVEYEIVAVDNRRAGYSLCQAYNIGASQARYPYLCFAHEDIAFLSDNWAQAIVDQLSVPTTGVIGFAGATGKPATMSTWSFSGAYHRINIRETADGVSHRIVSNPRNERFAEVVTLDGLCLFVRADVWAKVRFDEVTLDGFHLYDLDFSTAVKVAGYRNYVCYTVMVEHFSRGSFNTTWIEYSKKYHRKWADKLPIFVEDHTARQIEKIERSTHRRMAYLILKRHLLPLNEMRAMVQKTMRDFPFRLDSYLLWRKLKKNSKNSRKGVGSDK